MLFKIDNNEEKIQTCQVCYNEKHIALFLTWNDCNHKICITCGINYIYEQIACCNNSQISCHYCDKLVHFNEIVNVLKFETTFDQNIVQIILNENTIPNINYLKLCEKFILL